MRNRKACIFIFCAAVVCAIFVFGSAKLLRAAEDKVADLKASGASYVGMDTCAACHEKEAKAFKKSAHARLIAKTKNAEAQGCETCHGPGSLHADAETKADKHATVINPEKNPETCYKCHLDKKASFSLQYHHPVPEGKMGCADCHDPHGEDAIKPNTVKSVARKNQVCAKCHKDQTGAFVYEHEALREGCTVCHEVHGSINDKMLIERDSNLCLKCHFQSGFISDQRIGDNAHTGRIAQGPCWSGGCHAAPHGSNYNDHVRL